MKRGFTLIELLVVIVIIGVLAALLLPVTNRPKRAAKTVMCMSQLRQINIALHLYADDHGGSIRGTRVDHHIYFSYKDSIAGYLPHIGPATNDPLFICPADNFNCALPAIQDFFRGQGDTVAGKGFYQLKQTHYSSYIFNGAAENSRDTRAAEKSLSSALEPARLVLVCELSAAIGLSAHDRQQLAQFNNAKNVMSFVDGHASFIPIYWNGKSGSQNMPIAYNPPAGYDYIWFGQ